MSQEPIATRIKRDALAAGMSEQAARHLVLRARGVEAATQILSAAGNLSESAQMALFRDARYTASAALIQAFREAAEFSAVLKQCARTAPVALRQIEGYFERDNDGQQRLMPIAEARKKLIDAVAEMDEHIDTARPLGREDLQGIVAAGGNESWNGLSKHIFAQLAAKSGAGK